MRPGPRLAILAFSALGLFCATAAIWIHYRLLTDPTFVSPCDIGRAFNCTQVYLSRYGTIFGVPVAAGGLVWFGMAAGLAGTAKPDRSGAPSAAAGYLAALSLIGLAVIAYYGYVSFAVLKTSCLFCLGSYAAVLGVSASVLAAPRVGLGALFGRVRDDLLALTRGRGAVVTGALIVAILVVIAVFPRETASARSAAVPAPSQSVEDRFRQAWAAQPRVPLGIAADGAQVLVVKFNDFLCPGCKAMQDAYAPVFSRFEAAKSGAVKLVLRDFPWNSECNFTIQQTFPGHQGSCVAAAAVRLARPAGKDRDLGDWLFLNQQRLIEEGIQSAAKVGDTIKQRAKEAGVADFDDRYRATLIDVRRDVADGRVLGVSCTPTYYVNGVLTTSRDGQCTNLSAPLLELAIKIELEKAGAK